MRVFPWESLPDGAEGFDMGFGSGCWVPFVTPRVGALASTVRLLKPGASFLLYLYYRFDDRSLWFRTLWRASEIFRGAISRMPDTPKRYATDVIASLVYGPLSRIAWLYAAMGLSVGARPLSYRNSSLYTLRTDSRDRFGTPLERRFARDEIRAMMSDAGLSQIIFSDAELQWRAMGRRVA